MSNTCKLYNKSCYGLPEIENNSIEACIADPPYGISFQNNYWDKALPNPVIWADVCRILKPGAFSLVFSSIRLMHRLMVHIEDSGFIIRDVIFWAFLNGMPKTKDVALDIDKNLGIESTEIGQYKYVQGYKKGGASDYYATSKPKKIPYSELAKQFKGAGLNLKPAYEPIILIQKPIEIKLTVAQNLIKYQTGALNFEETRIPYAPNEEPVGHNPHEQGRVPANVLRTEPFYDGYDKFFLIPKVRQHTETYNHHPTQKPLPLMQHLVKLVSFENQTVIDPFMGSGSTGLACQNNNRNFIGYEIDSEYFAIAQKRLGVPL